ncbi:MAG TPA: hypothetical protein VEK07_19035 [Polyangiaceae bacterium]|nr:hypothetical protein [Polyangiaceae bacterium]
MKRAHAGKVIGIGACVTGGIALAPACSSSTSGSPGSAQDASVTTSSEIHYTPDAGVIANDAGLALQTFVPPTDPGAGGFVFSISGEVNAITGYPYPPYDSSQTWMVDGWNWKISKYIVVVDHITLWTNPNESTSNQELHGPVVAQVNGPWVVDLHKGGPLDGKGGGGEQALAIAALGNQNQNGGASFDPTQYYAFGFSTVPATYDAINVNLTEDEAADFAYMVAGGYSVYYYGTANWAGNQTGEAMFGLCSTNPAQNLAAGYQTCAIATSGSGGDAGAEDDADDAEVEQAGGGSGGGACASPYNFGQLPQQMTFQLGFSTPTNYVNCVNYTLSEQVGMDVRGVQVSTSESEIEQLTVHMDHPFWESFEEDTPVHWDQIAAQYIGQTNPVAHTEDFKGVAFNPFTDKNGTVLPWHWCESGGLYTPPGNGAMSFSTLSVEQDPGGVCTGPVGVDFTSPMDDCPGIRDYYDFIRYTQSTQGHLNSQGLCYIDRQYPAPAGGS